eukprot:scaffold93122_cov32-Tisochrysis_lutea.AAC.2
MLPSACGYSSSRIAIVGRAVEASRSSWPSRAKSALAIEVVVSGATLAPSSSTMGLEPEVAAATWGGEGGGTAALGGA